MLINIININKINTGPEFIDLYYASQIFLLVKMICACICPDASS